MEIKLADQQALENWAHTTLANALCRHGPGPHIILLQGDLGAGKTTLCKALIRGLSQNVMLEVPSPTYTLLQTYDTPHGPVWHFDLYRLHHPDEVVELGWDEVRDTFATLIEWPDRLGYLRPRGAISLAISAVSGSDTARIITLDGLDTK